MPVVLLATDSDALFDEVDAALSGDDLTVRRVSSGAVVPAVITAQSPVLVLLDSQIGNMGGVATCLAIRQEEGAGRLSHRPVALLLDRHADIFLAGTSGAEGWLIKPLDAIRLRQMSAALLDGESHFEGVVTTETA